MKSVFEKLRYGVSGKTAAIIMGGIAFAGCSTTATATTDRPPVATSSVNPSESPAQSPEAPSTEVHYDVVCTPDPDTLASQDASELMKSFSIKGTSPEELVKSAMRSECSYFLSGTTQAEIDEFKLANGTTDRENYIAATDAHYYESFDKAAYSYGSKIGASARIVHEVILDYASIRSDFGKPADMPEFNILGVNVSDIQVTKGSMEDSKVRVKFTYEPHTNLDEFGVSRGGFDGNKHFAGWLRTQTREYEFTKSKGGYTISVNSPDSPPENK